MLEEECLKIWCSQVLLPFTMNNSSYAFLGSFKLDLTLECWTLIYPLLVKITSLCIFVRLGLIYL